MSWIVLGEEQGLLKLVSKSSETGLLPKGSYLTVEHNESKYILRVDKSFQSEPYTPSPLIADMDLSSLRADQKCQNIVFAFRVLDINDRSDGKIDFVPPQTIARRSNQAEIDAAMDVSEKGPKVFVATVHGGNNQLLIDDEYSFITAHLPIDMFFHQILIAGKTGSGKTVATKYLAQYFVEELEGAVLAINVKDVDFLKMNRPSSIKNPSILEEWSKLGCEARGVDNYTVYYPANTNINEYQDLDQAYFEKATLAVTQINPEALSGILQGITDIAAQNLPDIFRYWLNQKREEGQGFNDFVRYFLDIGDAEGKRYPTENSRGDISEIPMHSGTYNSILRKLDETKIFFDNNDATAIMATDILQNGKMSIINVGSSGLHFGSIMLRHLLKGIVEMKSQQKSDVPILIIIDEVHNFYNTSSSQSALSDLDTICRQGRSQKIGVIFSSQNINDIPKGLDNVINTKIFFRSDSSSVSKYMKSISADEIETLKKGYACGVVHDLPKLKIMKFPVSFAGVFED